MPSHCLDWPQGSLLNNAFLNVDEVSGKEAGHNLGTANITLAALPVLGTQVAALLGTGDTTVRLSHDINGKARTLVAIDVGPEDFSSATTDTIGREYTATPDTAFSFGI